MLKLPPIVVSILAAAAGVATALLSSISNATLKEICIGVIAAAGTFGIGHSTNASADTVVEPVSADPYANNDK